MGENETFQDSAEAQEAEKKKGFLGQLFSSFADSLNQAPIGPMVLDTAEIPKTEKPNYTPLYIVAILAIGAVAYFAIQTGKK